MDDAIRFTVSLDDMVDTHRLAMRRYAIGGGVLFILVGLGIAALVNPAGLGIALLGALTLLLWRFPVGDRWLIRRRAAARVDSLCEVWLDETGIAYRQAGITGHIDWSAITRIVEDQRSLILMEGGIALMALPKRAFDSPEALARFVTSVRQARDRGRANGRTDDR